MTSFLRVVEEDALFEKREICYFGGKNLILCEQRLQSLSLPFKKRDPGNEVAELLSVVEFPLISPRFYLLEMILIHSLTLT